MAVSQSTPLVHAANRRTTLTRAQPQPASRNFQAGRLQPSSGKKRRETRDEWVPALSGGRRVGPNVDRLSCYSTQNTVWSLAAKPKAQSPKPKFVVISILKSPTDQVKRNVGCQFGSTNRRGQDQVGQSKKRAMAGAVPARNDLSTTDESSSNMVAVSAALYASHRPATAPG